MVLFLGVTTDGTSLPLIPLEGLQISALRYAGSGIGYEPLSAQPVIDQLNILTCNHEKNLT